MECKGPRSLSAEQLELKLTELSADIRMFLKSRIPRKFAQYILLEDLMQDVWTLAWHKLDTYRSMGPDSFRNWLLTIARNVLNNAINHWRAKCRGGGKRVISLNDRANSSFASPADEVVGPTPTPSSFMRADEKIDAVRVAVEGLEDDQRRAVMLRYIEELPNAEVASRLQRSETAVESLLFRAKRNLKQLLRALNRLQEPESSPRQKDDRGSTPHVLNDGPERQ